MLNARCVNHSFGGNQGKTEAILRSLRRFARGETMIGSRSLEVAAAFLESDGGRVKMGQQGSESRTTISGWVRLAE